MRRAQAMIETVFAVLIVTGILLVALTFSEMLSARIFLDHAAARAVRARTVGLNNYMCLKSAQVAMIPVAGKCLWPTDYEGDGTYLVPAYLASENPAYARGILEYERWGTSRLRVLDGLSATTAELRMQTQDDWAMDGAAAIETHAPFYMDFQGR